MKYTYHPMQMHLHTCHQPGASMESHFFNAHALGMHYIRFTDHDIRTGPKEYPCNGFDFSRKALIYEDLSGLSCGWEETYGEPDVSFSENSMIIQASSDTEAYTTTGVGFKSTEKRHTVSLLADVSLLLGFTFEAIGEARLVFDVRMSQRPPDHEPAHLRYVLGDICTPSTPHSTELPMPAPKGGVYMLHLSEDVSRNGVADIVGGLDNVFDSIAILLETKEGGSITVKMNRFEIKAKYGFNDVILRQRELADQIGACYSIKPFVTTEISAAGPHKNCFTTAVPIIDYAKRNYNVTQAEAIAHVKKYGGIFSYNHPFEKYKRMSVPKDQIPFIVQRDAAAFIAAKVWGASLLEVGFVDGRSGFALQEHLLLWDLISLGGVFITGYGDSDSHYGNKGWFDSRNFAAWVAADSSAVFPVQEEQFTQSMKAGRLYTGDPVFLKNPVDLTAGDFPMGAVICIEDHDHTPRKLTFTAAAPDKDWTMRIIIDGQPAREKPIHELLDDSGDLTFHFEVEPALPVSFARAELYNADGRCILLTNPIYLVRTAEFGGKIPPERLYEGEESSC